MNDQSRLIAEGIINNGYFVSPISPEEYASISTTSHKHFFFSFRFFFVRQRCGSSLQYVSSSVKTSYEYLREGESVMCRTRVALQRERERDYDIINAIITVEHVCTQACCFISKETFDHRTSLCIILHISNGNEIFQTSGTIRVLHECTDFITLLIFPLAKNYRLPG